MGVRQRRFRQGPAPPPTADQAPAAPGVASSSPSTAAAGGIRGGAVVPGDKSILLAEVVKLRQEQQSTRAGVQAMEARLQRAEQRQVQMMGFLARAMQNPDFFQHLALHQLERRRELEDAQSLSRKRRRPMPIDAAGAEQMMDEFEGLRGETTAVGASELERLALNIQGLGKQQQQQDEREKQGRGGDGTVARRISHRDEAAAGGDAAAELTDDFWEELLNEGMRGPAGAHQAVAPERRRPPAGRVQDLSFTSNTNKLHGHVE